MPKSGQFRSRPEFLNNLKVLGLAHTLALVGHYDFVQATQVLLDHRHPELMEICYLARGRQVYRVAGKDYALRAGEVFVTFPGEQHSTGGKPQEKGELFWLQLYLPRRGRFLNMPAEEARGIVEGLRHLPSRHFAARPAVMALFPRVFSGTARAMESGRLEGLERIDLCSVLSELLVEVIRSAAANDHAARDNADLNRVIEFVAEHVGEAIGVEDLSRKLGLSTSWFKAKFRRAMGIPPGEYILRAKVERAGEMLGSGLPVTEVAYRLGFSSSQYFATVFKRFTGKRPTEWEV